MTTGACVRGLDIEGREEFGGVQGFDRRFAKVLRIARDNRFSADQTSSLFQDSILEILNLAVKRALNHRPIDRSNLEQLQSASLGNRLRVSSRIRCAISTALRASVKEIGS